MRTYTAYRVLILVFGEEYREAEVEVTVNYYKTTYGEDADGNRGVPDLELGSYEIEIPTTCLNDQKITDEERDELYKDAFSEVMNDWETWAEGE